MWVLAVLAVIWGAVLLPPYLQNRRENRPGDSITMFRSQLSTLARATPGSRGEERAARPTLASAYGAYRGASDDVVRAGVGRPATSHAAYRRAEVRRRRREVFLTLLGAVGVTFLLALVMGGAVWVLHLLVLAAFGGYVALLVKLQQDATDRDAKVRYLPQPVPRVAPEPQLLLRRSGS